MLTRHKFTPPIPTGDSATDFRNLCRSISDFFGAFEQKNALQIDSAQIRAASGIVFPASQGAASSDAHTLDDYEEDAGAGALTVTFETPGTSSFSATENNYTYTKIGREVIFRFNVVGTITKGTASGDLVLTGLPFTNANVASNFPVGTVLWGDTLSAAGYTQLVPIIVPNGTRIQFGWSGAGMPAIDLIAGHITNGTLRLRGFIIFHV